MGFGLGDNLNAYKVCAVFLMDLSLGIQDANFILILLLIGYTYTYI